MKETHWLETLLLISMVFSFGYMVGIHTSKGLLYTRVDLELAKRAGITEGARTVAMKCDTKTYLKEGLK